jgi:hypothetical protein
MELGTETPRDRYQQRLADLDAQTRDRRQLSQRLTIVRSVLFLAGAAALIYGLTRQIGSGWGWTIAGWVLIAAFLVAITWHESVRLALRAMEIRSALYRRLIDRLDRHWPGLPFGGPIEGVTPDMATSDLDVFGPRSLFCWLSLCSTNVGRRTLARWLIEPVAAEVIERRQQAAQELRDQTRFREDFLWLSAEVSGTTANPDAFIGWASGPAWLPRHRIWHRLSWLGPALILIGITVLIAIGRGPIGAGAWLGIGLVGAGLAINLICSLSLVSGLHTIFNRISSGHGEVAQYCQMFEATRALSVEAPLLREIKARSVEGADSAVEGFRQLRVLIRMANLQRNAALYIPYLLLQIFAQWDLRVLELLERWQQRFGTKSEQWLSAIGQLESLLSVSAVYYDQPDWAVPEWLPDASPVSLAALQLGHPLLTDKQRVGNDVRIDRQHPLLLITGSNMAGKSTMLRSIGLNLVLSRCGSAVCSETFQSRTWQLATSISVRDSLQDGVSFFMAELHRLKQVVDLARQHHDRPDQPLLFLLDEILQGTNSSERKIAVAEVLEQLIELGASGCISTHDLELAGEASLAQVARIVHFREFFEQIDGVERMRFDYRMREGLTPTTNALKLLQLVGLGRARH